MAFPLRIPRINNNDDFVKLLKLHAAEGDRVKTGDCVAQIETDKAVVDLEAEKEGFLLKVLCEENERVPVGEVMMWFGDRADEPVPEPIKNDEPVTANRTALGPTAKARALIKRYGLESDVVPYQSERLTAADVEAYVAGRDTGSGEHQPAPARDERPSVPGILQELSPDEHGMLGTVAWHRDRAAATYLEVEYDQGPWEQHAEEFMQRHQLMMSPLIPLLAYRLVEIAAGAPKINATIVDGRRYQYDRINLGFTVQGVETLYLTVIQNAEKLDPLEFVQSLGEIQRRAIARKLKPEDVRGATIAFSSMARWNVSRHIPILPPHTSLIVAHAAPRNKGAAVMGASYDHRVLSGFDVIEVLEKLTRVPQTQPEDEKSAI